MDHTVFNVDHQLFTFGIGRFGKVFVTPSVLSLMFLFRNYTDEIWCSIGGARSTKEDQYYFNQGWSGIIQNQTSSHKSVRLDNLQLQVITELKQYILGTTPITDCRVHETLVEPQL